MQNQSNSLITFDSQLKTALITLVLVLRHSFEKRSKFQVYLGLRRELGTMYSNQVNTTHVNHWLVVKERGKPEYPEKNLSK